MIEVQNLSKFYGSFCAVNGVSFSVKEGEIVGFLGPNGAGKTTTIRVLTCFHPATSGTATVAGFDVFKDSLAVRANIGYLPESVPLYPEMRAKEYLRFRGKLRGLSGATIGASIDRVATRCWIKDVLHKPIGTLSKGYRQRVGLADALLHNPKVLVLDEPTVGLDPTQIRETRNLIRELAQDHTVILSSHILPEVEATCQRIVIINKGRIVASGTTGELRERIAGDSRVIAEIKGAEADITAGLRQISGVSDVQSTASNGWVRTLVASRSDPREDIFRVAASKGWPVRELRRETGTLEEFFVKIIAGQAAD